MPGKRGRDEGGDVAVDRFNQLLLFAGRGFERRQQLGDAHAVVRQNKRTQAPHAGGQFVEAPIQPESKSAAVEKVLDSVQALQELRFDATRDPWAVIQ